jgi:hypothetical protein
MWKLQQWKFEFFSSNIVNIIILAVYIVRQCCICIATPNIACTAVYLLAGANKRPATTLRRTMRYEPWKTFRLIFSKKCIHYTFYILFLYSFYILVFLMSNGPSLNQFKDGIWWGLMTYTTWYKPRFIIMNSNFFYHMQIKSATKQTSVQTWEKLING